MHENYEDVYQEVLQASLNALHEQNQERCPHDEDNGLQLNEDPACACDCSCGCGRCVWAEECIERRCNCTVDLKDVQDETESILAAEQMRRDLQAYYYSTRGI